MSDPATEEVFQNVLEVEEYLYHNGWKIKKSSIYNHVKKRLIIPDAQGRFLKTEVDRYALTNLRKADGTYPGNKKADRIAIDTAEHRRRRERAQADLIEMKVSSLKGSLVPRELFEGELAARAAIFRSDFESFFRAPADEIVHIVEGNAAKIPDLVAHLLEALETQLSRYLQKEEFKVDLEVYRKLIEKLSESDNDDIFEDYGTDEPISGDTEQPVPV